MKSWGYKLLGLGFYSRKAEMLLAWRISRSGPPYVRVGPQGSATLSIKGLERSAHFQQLVKNAQTKITS